MRPRFEFTGPGEQLFNYCLWEYRPQAPMDGKFHSINLLLHSFELAGLGQHAVAVVDTIRRAVGPSRTVWGLKHGPEGFRWEFYFYDYQRRGRERSISVVLEALKPFMPCPIVPNEDLHYFMFSIELTAAQLSGPAPLEKVNMYIGNVGSQVSSGISYSLTSSGRFLDNFYFFYHPSKHLDDIIGKVACSAYIDPPHLDPDLILWPELINCETICIANKRTNDCAYFSGINIDQFLFALKRLDYPAPLVAFIETNRSNLDHMLYDIGYDYRVGPDGLEILKTGYYGTF